jgi:hypothetical protein
MSFFKQKSQMSYTEFNAARQKSGPTTPPRRGSSHHTQDGKFRMKMRSGPSCVAPAMRAPSYAGEVGSNTEFETNRRRASPGPGAQVTGRSLANKGHDTRAIQGWLGHRSITSTAVYTALAPNRFKDFWRD